MAIKVTAEDVQDHHKETKIIEQGDFVLICAAPCYAEQYQAYSNGTLVITVKNHKPSMKPVARDLEKEYGEDRAEMD